MTSQVDKEGGGEKGERNRLSARPTALMGEGEAEARTSGGEPDITLRCVLGGADWALRAHRLDQQHREDGQLAPKIVKWGKKDVQGHRKGRWDIPICLSYVEDFTII